MTSKYHIHRPTHGSARRKHMSQTATQNQECNLVKQSALSDCKLEKTISILLQNKNQTQSPHKHWKRQQTMNQQLQNHRLRMDSSSSHILNKTRINRGSFMSAFKLLNLLRKRDKIFFTTSLINFVLHEHEC